MLYVLPIQQMHVETETAHHTHHHAYINIKELQYFALLVKCDDWGIGSD